MSDGLNYFFEIGDTLICKVYVKNSIISLTTRNQFSRSYASFSHINNGPYCNFNPILCERTDIVLKN